MSSSGESLLSKIVDGLVVTGIVYVGYQYYLCGKEQGSFAPGDVVLCFGEKAAGGVYETFQNTTADGLCALGWKDACRKK